MSIGQKIKVLRKRQDLNQQEFADALGVDRSNVSAWETDKAEPRFANLKAMARLFKVGVQELFEDEIEEGVEQPASGDEDNVVMTALALLLNEVAEMKADKLGITFEESLKQLKKKGGPTLSGLLDMQLSAHQAS